MSEVVDAEVVEETALAVQESHPVSLFGTTEPEEVIDKAAKHATALAKVINDKQLYSRISGRDHVQVEGWQLLGSMTGVYAVVTESKPITDSQGNSGWEAHCEARTMSGDVVGAADAMCTRSERTWKSRDDYAIRSMAQTRATSKALKGPLGFIVKLAGYSATPAEEMTFDDSRTNPTPESSHSAPASGHEGSAPTAEPNAGGASASPASPPIGSEEEQLEAEQILGLLKEWVGGNDSKHSRVRAEIAKVCLEQGAAPPERIADAGLSVLRAVAAVLLTKENA